MERLPAEEGTERSSKNVSKTLSVMAIHQSATFDADNPTLEDLEKELQIEFLQHVRIEEDCPFSLRVLEEQLLEMFSSSAPLVTSARTCHCKEPGASKEPANYYLRCSTYMPSVTSNYRSATFDAAVQSATHDADDPEQGGNEHTPPSHACLQGLKLGGKHVSAQPLHHGLVLNDAQQLQLELVLTTTPRAPVPIATEQKLNVVGTDISINNKNPGIWYAVSNNVGSRRRVGRRRSPCGASGGVVAAVAVVGGGCSSSSSNSSSSSSGGGGGGGGTLC